MLEKKSDEEKSKLFMTKPRDITDEELRALAKKLFEKIKGSADKPKDKK